MPAVFLRGLCGSIALVLLKVGIAMDRSSKIWSRSTILDMFPRSRGLAEPEPPLIRNQPLGILVVLADLGPESSGVLSAFRAHCALVCVSAEQAVDAAPSFAPDVVLIDLRLEGYAALQARLSANSDREIVFVALGLEEDARWPSPKLPRGFHYHLTCPAAACELEQLLWNIGRDVDDRKVKNAWFHQESERIG